MSEGGDKQFLMPIYYDTVAEPGSEGSFINTPQLACKPIRLIVTRETAEAFVVTDIVYGGCSQFIQCGVLWLHSFVAAVPECESCFVEVGAARDDPPYCYVPFFELDVVLPGMDMIMSVKNPSDEPRRFKGVWVVAVPGRTIPYGVGDHD